jgi:hypothetical protein
MTGLRIVVVVVLIVLWGLWVPAAMAADHCAAMSGMCEGPCGASCTVTGPTVPAWTGLVSRALSRPLPALPQPVPLTLEPPPRPLAPSA